jgi:type VI protein secretion system component VasK
MFRLVAALLRMTGEIAVIESVRQAVRTIAVDIILSVLAVVTSVAIIGCLAASLWIYADQRYGAVAAPLIVAGMLAILCIIAMLAVARPWRRAAKTSSTRRVVRAAGDQALEPVRLLGAAAHGFVRGLAGEDVSRG